MTAPVFPPLSAFSQPPFAKSIFRLRLDPAQIIIGVSFALMTNPFPLGKNQLSASILSFDSLFGGPPAFFSQMEATPLEVSQSVPLLTFFLFLTDPLFPFQRRLSSRARRPAWALTRSDLSSGVGPPSLRPFSSFCDIPISSDSFFPKPTGLETPSGAVNKLYE